MESHPVVDQLLLICPQHSETTIKNAVDRYLVGSFNDAELLQICLDDLVDLPDLNQINPGHNKNTNGGENSDSLESMNMKFFEPNFALNSKSISPPRFREYEKQLESNMPSASKPTFGLIDMHKGSPLLKKPGSILSPGKSVDSEASGTTSSSTLKPGTIDISDTTIEDVESIIKEANDIYNMFSRPMKKTGKRSIDMVLNETPVTTAGRSSFSPCQSSKVGQNIKKGFGSTPKRTVANSRLTNELSNVCNTCGKRNKQTWETVTGLMSCTCQGRNETGVQGLEKRSPAKTLVDEKMMKNLAEFRAQRENKRAQAYLKKKIQARRLQERGQALLKKSKAQREKEKAQEDLTTSSIGAISTMLARSTPASARGPMTSTSPGASATATARGPRPPPRSATAPTHSTPNNSTPTRPPTAATTGTRPGASLMPAAAAARPGMSTTLSTTTPPRPAALGTPWYSTNATPHGTPTATAARTNTANTTAFAAAAGRYGASTPPASSGTATPTRPAAATTIANEQIGQPGATQFGWTPATPAGSFATPVRPQTTLAGQHGATPARQTPATQAGPLATPVRPPTTIAGQPGATLARQTPATQARPLATPVRPPTTLAGQPSATQFGWTPATPAGPLATPVRPQTTLAGQPGATPARQTPATQAGPLATPVRPPTTIAGQPGATLARHTPATQAGPLATPVRPPTTLAGQPGATLARQTPATQAGPLATPVRPPTTLAGQPSATQFGWTPATPAGPAGPLATPVRPPTTLAGQHGATPATQTPATQAWQLTATTAGLPPTQDGQPAATPARPVPIEGLGRPNPPPAQAGPAAATNDNQAADGSNIDMVTQLFPDVDPNHLEALRRRFVGHGNPEMITNMVCNDLLENGFPKRLAANAEPAPAPVVPPEEKVDYYSYQFSSEHLGACYHRHARKVLEKDFAKIRVANLHNLFGANRFSYAKTRKHVLELLEKAGVEYREICHQNFFPCRDVGYLPYVALKINWSMMMTSQLNVNSLLKDFVLIKNERRVAFTEEIDETLRKEIQFVHDDALKKHEKADLEMATQLNMKDYEETGQSIECGCCYGDYPFEDMVQCFEGHLFCATCLKSYIQEAVFGQGKSRLQCMSEDCDAGYPRSMMERVLTQQMIEKFEEREQFEALNLADIENLFKCPACQFAAIIEPQVRVFVCQNPDCKKECCTRCKEDWKEHMGKRCEEVEKRDETKLRLETEEKMTKAKIRVCSKCKKGLVKSDGCNKMTCTCGTTMCYICRTPQIDYKHFCQHIREPGHGCTICKACSLWTNPDQDDERAIDEIRDKALEDAKNMGFASNKYIGAPEEPPAKKRKTDEQHNQHNQHNQHHQHHHHIYMPGIL